MSGGGSGGVLGHRDETYDPPDIGAAARTANVFLRTMRDDTASYNLARAFLATLSDLDQAEKERDAALLGDDHG